MVTFGRRAWLLIFLLAIATVLATVQNRALSAGRISVLQAPGHIALTPLERVSESLKVFFGRLTHPISTDALDARNRDLSDQVALLRVQNDRLSRLAAENSRLRLLLKMKQRDSSSQSWVAAGIALRHASHWFEYITLDQGAAVGIKKGSVALTAEGLVGRVITVSSNTCDVLLLTDPSSNAGAIVERTHDTGYVQGTGHGDLRMGFFDRGHGVHVGDRVVSSPLSSTYPSGIPIGAVTSITQDPTTGACTAMVHPAVSFDSLEDVLIIP